MSLHRVPIHPSYSSSPTTTARHGYTFIAPSDSLPALIWSLSLSLLSLLSPPTSRRRSNVPLPPFSLRIYDSAISPRLATPPSSQLIGSSESDSSSLPETPLEAQRIVLILSRSLLDVSPFFDSNTFNSELYLEPLKSGYPPEHDSLPSTSSSSRKRPVRTKYSSYGSTARHNPVSRTNLSKPKA